MSSSFEPSPQIAIIIDEARTGSLDHFSCLSGWQWESLRGKILRAGLSPESLSVILLSDLPENYTRSGGVVLGLGEATLRRFTGKRGIDKWHLSPFRLEDGTVFIPTYDFGRTQRQYELGLYQEMALHRVKEFATNPPQPQRENFRLNPGIEETLAILKEIKDLPTVACDVETGYGQINTVGFAWSESDAIAINVLPDRCGDVAYYELWDSIRAVLEGPSGKIFQNFIYDTSYFSAYGIRTHNIAHDTMHAMKVLWPELDQNLGNVGRVYTRRPYWKDDGRVEGEEGKKKDWGAVRDWVRHYTYNCRDTTGTFEASERQRADLTSRGLDEFFYGYVLHLCDPTSEMCARGVPVCGDTRDALKCEVEGRLEELTRTFQAKAGEVNPRSPKQVLKWLRAEGVKLPKKFDKKSGQSKESSDAKSIKKIRLKDDRPGLKELQEIKTLDKALSSYINFDLRADRRLSYSLNITGTETLRWSGGKDAWERGFNIQTIPREGGDVSIKSMFVAPEGFTFIEADLSQAETRYVAYASASKKLIDMLESKADVHAHVAHAILRALGLPSAEYSKLWRNLGKKTGHGANYLMKERTFVENVFNDMDKILTPKEGRIILDSYFEEFPEIRAWHGHIRNELYTKRRLRAPSGWERYFYGRPGDEQLREAVPWAPQHVVPWITNRMMLHLAELRRAGSLKFQLLVQVHDALYLLVPDDEVEKVARACLKTEAWHPEIQLPGGSLVIPTEVETAKCLAHKEKFNG
jgi:DNA polymerase I-like protein with 3'-5' exonuclease and polymerase domains